MSGGVSPFGGYAGQAWQLTSGGSQFNAMAFLVRQIIAGKAFAGMVRVDAVHGGGPNGPPTVDVQPMVNQIDGFGNQVPHGIVYGLPVYRPQGGAAAMIVDPVAGDTGEAIICDRDISIVKATGAVSGPGSFRQNDWADGCYYGAFLGEAAQNYVQITQTAVNVAALTQISLMVGGFGIVITATGTTIDGVPFLSHGHSGVMVGGGNTGPVVP